MVVLLTDFGHSEYVGIMKAVIYSISRQVQIVDLCHTVKPQGIVVRIDYFWKYRNQYT
ncbi:MAG: SAM-dependent chlorinase/fluorinase [Planctomycetota bacterium]